MTQTRNRDGTGLDHALEPRPVGADGAAAPDEQMAALLRRHGSDPAFRAAVDDMAAASGLSLEDCSLGRELDDIIRLARYKRKQAA